MQGYINNAGAEQVFTSRHSQSRLGGIFRVSRVGPDFLHGPAAENINHRSGALEVRDTVIGRQAQKKSTVCGINILLRTAPITDPFKAEKCKKSL